MDGTAMSRAAVLRALRRPGGRHGDGVRSLGWTPEELAEYRYAQHWNPQMAPLAPHVLQALGHSPVAEELLAPMAREVRDIEGSATRHGYAVTSAGAIHVHLATPMPGVTPAMIDWWFGWHSDSPERYRLWHPRAHVDARWESEPPAATEGRARYLGHTSIVTEYLGSHVGRYAIAFRPPSDLGIEDQRLADDATATAVCARIGLADIPLDAGWLAHLVVADPAGVNVHGGGSVMHSRFWIGGPYAAARSPRLSAVVSLGARFARPGAADARALLVHCAEEMTHLASFLPELYAQEGVRE